MKLIPGVTQLPGPGQCALLELLGHSHLSEIQAVHTTDRALGDAVARFIATLRGARFTSFSLTAG